MTKIRTIRKDGRSYADIDDIRKALQDDDMIARAAAMLKVASDKGDFGLEVLRKGISWFFIEGIGILAHDDN